MLGIVEDPHRGVVADHQRGGHARRQLHRHQRAVPSAHFAIDAVRVGGEFRRVQRHPWAVGIDRRAVNDRAGLACTRDCGVLKRMELQTVRVSLQLV